MRRLAFFGTPEIAVPTLSALCEAGFDVALVVTRADKRRGRGGMATPSPVKIAALASGLRVTHRVDDVLLEHRRQPIDLGIVVAYGALIKGHVLQEMPMVNLHVSLLPRWRGAAPIERAILAGDTRTGVCLMQLEEGLDTGGIIDCRTMEISPSTTADEIRSVLITAGTTMLVEHLRSGGFDVRPQEGEAIYAPKIEAEERRIDWTRSAEEISRLVRIGDAWTDFRNRRVKIHRARIGDGATTALPGTLVGTDGNVVVACGVGTLDVSEIQSEGRPRVEAVQWARGMRLTAGEGFGRG